MAITRELIAAALSTVDGVTGQPGSPKTITRGLGWSQWRSTTPLNRYARATRWYVYVAVSGGSVDAAIAEALTLTEPVIEALLAIVGPNGEQLRVEVVEPVISRQAETGGDVWLVRWSCVE
jgi:hypothetical protein